MQPLRARAEVARDPLIPVGAGVMLARTSGGSDVDAAVLGAEREHLENVAIELDAKIFRDVAGLRSLEQAPFQLVELGGASLGRPLGAKVREQSVHHRQCPASLEERFGSGVIHRLDHVQALSVLERDHLPATAALLRPFTRRPVREVMLQRGQKERAESSPTLAEPLEVLPLDERCQEPLRQVARIFRVEPTAADVGVEWIPVGPIVCSTPSRVTTPGAWVLREVKAGREKLFIHPNLMKLLTAEDHKVPEYRVSLLTLAPMPAALHAKSRGGLHWAKSSCTPRCR